MPRNRPVQITPLAQNLRQSLRACPAQGFIYLNNPKVGCTTVKTRLWCAMRGVAPSAITDVHSVEGSPFTNDPAALGGVDGAFVFSFTRNPFARIVSAYLNKVEGGRDAVWRAFAARAGRDPGVATSFDDFVAIISAHPPERLDPHWRPQYLNLLYPFVVPNLLADIDLMDDLLPPLLERLLPGAPVGTGPAGGAPKTAHHTNARARYRAYLDDPATVARIQSLYAADFELFGYDPDPAADPACRLGPRVNDHDHAGLAALVAYHAAGPARGQRLDDIAAADQGGHLADWILARRLMRAEGKPARREALKTRHAEQIAGGTAFLRAAAD